MESTDHELNKTNKIWLQPKAKAIWQQQVLSRQSFDHAQLCVVKVKIAKLFHLRADHSTYPIMAPAKTKTNMLLKTLHYNVI